MLFPSLSIIISFPFWIPQFSQLLCVNDKESLITDIVTSAISAPSSTFCHHTNINNKLKYWKRNYGYVLCYVWHTTKDEGEKGIWILEVKADKWRNQKERSRETFRLTKFSFFAFVHCQNEKDVTRESKGCVKEEKQTNIIRFRYAEILAIWRKTEENNLHGNCNFQSAFSSLFWQTNFPLIWKIFIKTKLILNGSEHEYQKCVIEFSFQCRSAGLFISFSF